MISSFNIADLKKLLHSFYLLTRIRITIFDENFREIVAYPNELPEFCSLIRTDKRAYDGCMECDRNACQKARYVQKTYIYRCHAGLIEAISPMKMGNLVIGYTLFGHIAQSPDLEKGWENVREKCAGYDVDVSRLKDAYRTILYVSDETLIAAANILEAVASFVCVSHMASLKYDSIPVQIDAFLTDHLKENITCGSICSRFQISRTKLYQIAEQNYNMGLASYLRKLRMEKAEKLLKESDMPIRISGLQLFHEGFPEKNGIYAEDLPEKECLNRPPSD